MPEGDNGLRPDQSVTHLETSRIEHYGREILVSNSVSLKEYVSRLNRMQPNEEVDTITGADHYSVVGWGPHPPDVIITDAIITGFNQPDDNFIMLGKPSYLAWIAHDMGPATRFLSPDGTGIKDTGKFYTHHLMTDQSIGEIRKRLKEEVPGNTLKLVYSPWSVNFRHRVDRSLGRKQ